MLLIALHLSVACLTANEALGIKDSVLWVGVVRILSGITNSECRVNATTRWSVKRTPTIARLP